MLSSQRIKIFIGLFFILTSLITGSSQGAVYRVDDSQSHVSFEGAHAGNPFKGLFQKWTANIDFDTENPEKSAVSVIFDMSSAHTGNQMYDGTLPTVDWFDVAQYPQALFQSSSFEKDKNGYVVAGNLTIKNITKPITFNFTLNNTDPTIMDAQITINRLDYNIGSESDADGEWVSKDIMIAIHLTTTKQ